MKSEFLGYHSEWNLGSPGGWVYQKMAQEIGKLAWERILKKAKIDVSLDFDDPVLYPVSNFAELLMRAHKKRFPRETPYIALVAEEETLEKVGENIKFVEYLNTLPKVEAVLIPPTKLESSGERISSYGKNLTTVFLDFNNNVAIKLKKEKRDGALLLAIEKGLVTNPRGMEPVGAKGLFELVTSLYKDKMAPSTVKRTPWTRQFYSRKTIGPDGGEIPDLIEWTKANWQNVILKPVHGYSGKGIIIGHKEPDIEKSVEHALKRNDYIVQPLIPLDVWGEDFPWLDKEKKTVFIKRWQTDFRCFVTDVGLIGFVTRFGGIPTNVGSGGGVQSTAIIRSKMPLHEAVKKVNDAILKLGYDYLLKVQEEMERRSVEIGNVYLLGPIMCTLRPRIITQEHVTQLKEYAEHLWHDALFLERLWLEGKLDKFVQISKEEEEIARIAPWKGKPALIAADGLFGFRG